MSGHIGAQIKLWRARRGGMTQEVLAGLAGISQPYLSQIETGMRPLDRKDTQIALARALNISVAQLVNATDTEQVDPMREQALIHVPQICAALIEISAGEVHEFAAIDQETARREVLELTGLRNASDYAALAPRLPRLLRALSVHGDGVHNLTPQYVEALFAARFALRSMGRPDMAREAAQLGLDAARKFGDPAWTGQAIYSWVQAFPAESAELGARIIKRAADDLQLDSTRNAKEVYGCLHILAAHQEAIAQHPHNAEAHLNEAADVAAFLGEPQRTGPLSAGFNGNWFSPAQVDIWRVACAAELGDTGTALTVASRIDLSAIPLPNRHVYYFTDLARALAADEKDREALEALARAERAAPQHFRFNPVVRDLTATIITRARRRSVTDQMSDLAKKLGIHPI